MVETTYSAPSAPDGCPGSGSWSTQPGATSSRMAAASPAGITFSNTRRIRALLASAVIASPSAVAGPAVAGPAVAGPAVAGPAVAGPAVAGELPLTAVLPR